MILKEIITCLFAVGEEITYAYSCLQDTDFREWKLVIQEIVKFLKADTGFMNIRPLRYSVVLDHHPDSLPNALEAKRKLKLKDALLCSYHTNEVCTSSLYFLWEKTEKSCSNGLQYVVPL